MAVTVNLVIEFINIVQKILIIFSSLDRDKRKSWGNKINGTKIIKAIKVIDEKDIGEYKKYENADIILFDTPAEKSIKFPKDLILKLPKGEGLL